MIVATIVAAVAVVSPNESAEAMQAERGAELAEVRISVGKVSLQAPTIGSGQPVIVLHGGPDFDYGYLLPELDRLKDAFRLIYYDQRGRGRSAEHVRPEDVTLASDVEDDPETVAARYRIHFKPALHRAEHYEKLMTRMKAGFISQGKDGILKARAVEDRLMHDSWESSSYDLLPKLRSLNIPTLVITGEQDFIPLEIAERIGRAIPNARFVTLKECGHFAYLECAGDLGSALEEFFRR